MSTAAPHGREWLDFLAAELGTDKWVRAARLSPYLRSKGYTVAISPGRWLALEAAFNAQQGTAKAERVALALFPDDFHDGSDCRAEIGREGQPCRACAEKTERWQERIRSVSAALTTEGLI